MKDLPGSFGPFTVELVGPFAVELVIIAREKGKQYGRAYGKFMGNFYYHRI